MDQVGDMIRGVSIEFCLLLITLCSLLKPSHAVHNNATYPPYRVIPLGEDQGSKTNTAYYSQTKILPMDSEQTHAHRLTMHKKPLEIEWLNSSTDSISFGWMLSNKYSVEGFIRESVVEYLQTGGKYTSAPLHPSVKGYTFRNLDVSTTYTICVYMIEIYGARNESTRTHSRCVKISTIDYIRKDSVLFVMLILGYYLFMGVLGCMQWKRKCWEIERRNRARSSRCDTPVVDKCAMRWKDLEQKEQREKLVAGPGCSIENNDT